MTGGSGLRSRADTRQLDDTGAEAPSETECADTDAQRVDEAFEQAEMSYVSYAL